MLTRPDVDYESLFGTQIVGRLGVFVWRIEDFLPVPIPAAEHGQFYEGDCYLVLDNHENEGLD